jgi:hypothetical protein
MTTFAIREPGRAMHIVLEADVDAMWVVTECLWSGVVAGIYHGNNVHEATLILNTDLCAGCARATGAGPDTVGDRG